MASSGRIGSKVILASSEIQVRFRELIYEVLRYLKELIRDPFFRERGIQSRVQSFDYSTPRRKPSFLGGTGSDKHHCLALTKRWKQTGFDSSY